MLTKLYGGYESLYATGLPQLRQMFPYTGITFERIADVSVDDKTYPGDVDLYDFVTMNSHKMEDMLVK